MTADTIGGVWTYCMQLCKALELYPVEIHLCTMGALVSQHQFNQLSNLKNVVLYESNYKLEWMEDCQAAVAEAGYWIRKIYDKVKPDLIHFNNYGQANQIWNCPVITVYHSCVQTWWRAVHGEAPPASWDWYTAVVQSAIGKSDVIVAPTHAMLQQAAVAFGSFPIREVIYNGIEAVPAQLQSKPVILTAGRIWDEAKNIGLLCRIAGELLWPLYIAGNNSGFVTEGAALKNTHFLGQLPEDEMQQLMAKSSIFVMPSKYEPFGLAVLEAAKAGNALVLADIPTFREVWGDAALYFNPFDENAARDVINSVIQDATLRNEYTAKAKEKAAQFTAAGMAEQYYRLYNKVLQLN